LSRSRPIVRIEVLLRLGSDRLAGSDDPLYLGLHGPAGREFRLAFGKGRALRRGAQDHFVFAAAKDPATNVAHAEFNDPGAPSIDAASVTGVYLRKGFEPIPNVRAIGELDDRVEIEEVSVEIHCEGGGEPLRFARRGPVWLGLHAGLRFEIPPVAR
jgi:hypothetical protein